MSIRLVDLHIKDKPEFSRLNLTSIHCNACGKSFRFTSKSPKSCIESHEKSQEHQISFKSWQNRKLQQVSIDNSLTHFDNSFTRRLARTFLECNIPLYKLNYPSMKRFILGDCGKIAPDESVVRKLTGPLAAESIRMVKDQIGEKFIYLQIDESSDQLCRPVVSVLVGALDGLPSKPFLIDVIYLEKCPNSMKVSQIITDSIKSVWPDLDYNRLRLLVSDQAPYMMKAGALLKHSLFGNLLHVSCLCNALHLVCDLVRKENPNLNRMSSLYKKVFVNSAGRGNQLVQEVGGGFPKFPIKTLVGELDNLL